MSAFDPKRSYATEFSTSETTDASGLSSGLNSDA
jgi:hypothetical protein